jgi:hypothetical protein
MRTFAIVVLAGISASFLPGAEKLTMEDRIELTRGLTAEYANAKILLPRSKGALEFNADSTFDKKKWSDVAKESGPAARVGDQVQVTKVMVESDKIVLEINGGFRGGRKWYSGVQIGVNNGPTQPVSRNDSNAPGGTSIAILFHKPVEPIKASAIKKMLAPVLDFDKRSATELYADTLPPEVQKAIKDKHVTEGMTRDQVIMSMGRPEHKSRETRDGIDFEDWVYGAAPGKITFVTFKGEKVAKVKESYAGLGTQVSEPVVH